MLHALRNHWRIQRRGHVKWPFCIWGWVFLWVSLLPNRQRKKPSAAWVYMRIWENQRGTFQRDWFFDSLFGQGMSLPIYISLRHLQRISFDHQSIHWNLHPLLHIDEVSNQQFIFSYRCSPAFSHDNILWFWVLWNGIIRIILRFDFKDTIEVFESYQNGNDSHTFKNHKEWSSCDEEKECLQ